MIADTVPVNIGETWHAGIPSINIASAWHTIVGMWINLTGSWYQWYTFVRLFLGSSATTVSGYLFGSTVTATVVNGTPSSYSWSIISGSGTIVSGQGTYQVTVGYQNGSQQPTVQCTVVVNGNSISNTIFL